MYGLIKVHKTEKPTRPVISMINTSEYKLAKFLDSIIKPFVSVHFMLNSSTDFIKKLEKASLNSRQKLVSFDVKSLFTNVPLNEVIDMISEKIYSGKTKNIEKPPIEKRYLRNC